MAETRGIEVFGRNATVVETVAASPARRTVVLGVLSVLLGLATAACTAFGVVAATADDLETARWIAYAAVGSSILGAFAGFAAMVTRRGAALGALGLLLSIAANPVLLTRLLAAVDSMAV